MTPHSYIAQTMTPIASLPLIYFFGPEPSVIQNAMTPRIVSADPGSEKTPFVRRN